MGWSCGDGSGFCWRWRPLAAAGLLYAYERSGAELACPFYRLTGLYCPGCGSGRAVRALLHGHLLQALSYNYLLDLLLVPALCVCAWGICACRFPGQDSGPSLCRSA